MPSRVPRAELPTAGQAGEHCWGQRDEPAACPRPALPSSPATPRLDPVASFRPPSAEGTDALERVQQKATVMVRGWSTGQRRRGT